MCLFDTLSHEFNQNYSLNGFSIVMIDMQTEKGITNNMLFSFPFLSAKLRWGKRGRLTGGRKENGVFQKSVAGGEGRKKRGLLFFTIPKITEVVWACRPKQSILFGPTLATFLKRPDQ